MPLPRLLASLFVLAAFSAPAIAQEEAAAPAEPPAAAAPASSVQSAITLTLSGARNAERRVIAYTCENSDGFSVEYINAVPNFLALLPIEGETMIFNAVISASGVRYVAAQYEWWTEGQEATLRDLTQGEDAEPLASCSEFSNIP